MTSSPRATLYALLMADGVHGRGHSPDRSERASELLDAYRDQVLAEAAEMIRQHRGDIDDDAPWWDTRDRDTAAGLLLAARTTTAQLCPCRERGQRGDGWVRYQARDGEFVELRCRNHEAACPAASTALEG